MTRARVNFLSGLIALVASASLPACAGDAKELPSHAKPPPAPPATCLMALKATDETSLDTVPLGDGQLRDFPTRVAATLVADGFVPEPRLSSLALDQHPVFYSPPDRSPTIVDAVYFSNLKCVDATRARKGDVLHVGIAHESAMNAGPRAIAEVLVRSGVVRPYVHIEAELCLVSESSGDEGWSGRFEGSHTYYTNEKSVDPLAFDLDIAKNGDITVRGELPR